MWNFFLGSNMTDPFVGFFITKQTARLKELGNMHTLLLLDILHAQLSSTERIEIFTQH